MTNEIKNSASTAVLNAVKSVLPNVADIRIGNRNMLAIDTGVTDNGKPVYATIDICVKNTQDTATNPAYNHESAVANYADWLKAHNEHFTGSSKAPKNTEAQARKAKRIEAVEAWIADNGCEKMTTTDFVTAMPDVYSDVMALCTCGTDLKALVADGKLTVEVIEGKKYYTAQ